MSRVRNWWWFIDRVGDYEAHMHAVTKTVIHTNTKFQEVGIAESIAYGKILTLDGDMQSSEYDEFIYHESIVHPALLSHKNPEKVLILGGGEGATLREVLRHKTVKQVVMIDIDAELVEICKKYLPTYSCGAFDDKRVKLYSLDAVKWLSECTEQFDVIIADLIDPLPETPAEGIYSLGFFEDLKKCLAPGGVFYTQSSRITFTDMYLHNVLYKTLKEVFPKLATSFVHVPGFDVTWSFTAASSDVDVTDISAEEIDKRISERIDGELRFYDGSMHKAMFVLPKYLRKRREDYLSNPDKYSQASPHYLI